ncbi:MAG: hypothetical protein Q4A90_08525 [Streptococcus sp.]|nr:hypothetical protein [Streptococcus sp.]
MKKRKYKGASLPMVIVTVVFLALMIGIVASVVSTSNKQTQRLYSYINAKYVATSGSQLALGAYFEGEGGKSSLYTEFQKRAEGHSSATTPVTSIHKFSFGTAEITMTGAFTDGSTAKEDYNITIVSRAKLLNSDDYYVHTVVFNFDTNGIRSEKGGLESKK